MKKFYGSFAALMMLVAGFAFESGVEARVDRSLPLETPAISTSLVISQFQAGGTTAEDEFVEIHNVGTTSIDLNGYRIVYRSSSGTTDVGPFAVWTTTTIIQPGQYYLTASNAYDGSPVADHVWNPGAVGSMAAGAGGLAIRQGPQNTGVIIDAVGWGTASNIFFEGTRTPAPGNNNSEARFSNGCRDTDNNAGDFFNSIPSAPRNTGTSVALCGTDPTQLYASVTANPSTVAPGGTTLFAVTVVPGVTPPSTAITVIANLTEIGGTNPQFFFDDGTNGDVTPGDNVFSYRATIPAAQPSATYLIAVSVADAQGRSVPLIQQIIVGSTTLDEDPLTFGNPSNATTNVANENNYLMPKPQYTLSYNRAKATANWTAWRLDTSWLGSAPRQDDFRPDTSLPAGWYQVQDNDYSGSGYNRGHLCPSADRTRSVPDNSATFLMTNMMPHLGANNQGPWNDFENYIRGLVNQGNEVYQITGPAGNIGTIAQGRIVVPAVTWKVVIVLPNGSNDVQRVTRTTRAFGIVVSNQPPITSNQWRTYRVTVDAVEYLTGFNFFSAIPKNTQELIERKRDKQ